MLNLFTALYNQQAKKDYYKTRIDQSLESQFVQATRRAYLRIDKPTRSDWLLGNPPPPAIVKSLLRHAIPRFRQESHQKQNAIASSHCSAVSDSFGVEVRKRNSPEDLQLD